MKYKGLAKKEKGLLGDTDDVVAQLKSTGFYFFNMMTPPGQSETILLEKVEKKVKTYKDEVEAFIANDIQQFKIKVNDANINLFDSGK